MSRFALSFIFYFCCISTLLANQVTPPDATAPASEAISFLAENAINNPQSVIEFIEKNDLITRINKPDDKVHVYSYYAQAYQYKGDRKKGANALNKCVRSD